MEIKKKLQSLHELAKKAYSSSDSSQALYSEKVKYMGKKGEISRLMGEMKNLSPEERPLLGKVFNQIQKDLDDLYLKKQEELKIKEVSHLIEKETLDVSLPGPHKSRGALHPISKTIDRIVNIFSPLGYTVRTGPFIESDWYNFEALNIPPFHPSRDEQDTFYINKSHVLRTHTSPVQIHVLEREKPPLAVLAPGAAFRSDDMDASHSPMFHQVEGLFVDKKVSLADLKGLLSYFLKKLFGSHVKVRFRPSFFPFTEPSAEYDVSCVFCKGKGCSFCKQSGWIEVGGCGLVHPKVFESAKLSPDLWQGFAFGLGVERLAIILYGIPDIRLFYQNDLRFLKQFEAL